MVLAAQLLCILAHYQQPNPHLGQSLASSDALRAAQTAAAGLLAHSPACPFPCGTCRQHSSSMLSCAAVMRQHRTQDALLESDVRVASRVSTHCGQQGRSLQHQVHRPLLLGMQSPEGRDSLQSALVRAC